MLVYMLISSPYQRGARIIWILRDLVGAEHGGADLQSQRLGGGGETQSSGLSTLATWLYSKFEVSLHYVILSLIKKKK